MAHARTLLSATFTLALVGGPAFAAYLIYPVAKSASLILAAVSALLAPLFVAFWPLYIHVNSEVVIKTLLVRWRIRDFEVVDVLDLEVDGF